MRTKRAIENQIAHFRTACAHRDDAETEIWIKALEWVLGPGDDPAVNGSSPVADLIAGSITAVHALRSYQYGNDAPDLASGVADHLQRAISEALDMRDEQISRLLAEAQKMSDVLAELHAALGRKKPAD